MHVHVHFAVTCCWQAVERFLLGSVQAVVKGACGLVALLGDWDDSLADEHAAPLCWVIFHEVTEHLKEAVWAQR